MRHRLQGIFRPELLSRIDEVILFSPLGKEACTAIVCRLLDETCRRAEEAGLTLVYDDAAAALLAEAGYDPAYGARILRQTVTERVENVLSDRLLLGELRAGDCVRLSVREGELLLAKETQNDGNL